MMGRVGWWEGWDDGKGGMVGGVEWLGGWEKRDDLI